jgi:hypothetical protein
LEHGDNLAEGVPIALEEVGDDDGDTSAYACHAVDEHVRLLPSLFYEVVGVVKVAGDVVFLMVFSGDVEIMRDIFSFMRDESAPGNGQDGPDVFACIT